MKLRQLELLRAVIRCETTVRAAQELGLSQPAVSNAIKHLEAHLGFALFERVNNRLFATPEALMIYRETEHLFQVYRGLDKRISDIRENRLGSIRLLATPPMGHSIIPLALRSFQEQHPKIVTHFDICGFSATMAGIEAGAADLGFIIGSGVVEGPGAEVFFSEPMVCIMPPGHPLAVLEEVGPADIADHAFISLQADTRMGLLVRSFFEACDVPFRFRTEVRYCNTACILVQAGVGVALVDSLSALTCAGDQLVLRRTRPERTVSAAAIWSDRRPLSRPAQQFLRHVSREAQRFARDRAALAASKDAGSPIRLLPG